VVVLLTQCSPTAEESAALEAIPPEKRNGPNFGPVRMHILALVYCWGR